MNKFAKYMQYVLASSIVISLAACEPENLQLVDKVVSLKSYGDKYVYFNFLDENGKAGQAQMIRGSSFLDRHGNIYQTPLIGDFKDKPIEKYKIQIEKITSIENCTPPSFHLYNGAIKVNYITESGESGYIWRSPRLEMTDRHGNRYIMPDFSNNGNPCKPIEEYLAKSTPTTSHQKLKL